MLKNGAAVPALTMNLRMMIRKTTVKNSGKTIIKMTHVKDGGKKLRIVITDGNSLFFCRYAELSFEKNCSCKITRLKSAQTNSPADENQGRDTKGNREIY